MRYKNIFGLLTFIIQVILFKSISKHPEWIENVFIPHVFSPISTFFRKVTAQMPFSIGLILVYILSLFLIYFLVRNIYLILKKRKSLKNYLLQVFNWLSPIYFFFMITWGILYYRQPITTLLGYDTSPVTTEELKQLCEDLVEQTNETRSKLQDSEIDETTNSTIFLKAPQGFTNTGLSYLNYSDPSIKMATGSVLLAYMGTGGIYTFWSGEANVNKVQAIHDLPEVALHEMAHQMGFASEDEASYIAWLVGKNHPDKLFRYSANYNVTWRALGQLWRLDSTYANLLYSKLDSSVYRDLEVSRKRWKPYKNLVQEYVVRPFYGFFLKANGQEEGIMAYDRVVDLIVFERRKY